jgi:glycosyltransferase involved in cell wall biosynthesis
MKPELLRADGRVSISPMAPPQANPPRERDLHVAHSVLALDVGGLERIVLDLVRCGRRSGQRVSVICIERPGTLAAEAERLGAQVISLDKPPGRKPEAIRTALDALRELTPDVIHTHQVGALWYLGRAARLAGHLPVVHTEHGNHIALSPGIRARLRTRLLMRDGARFADYFCCVSADIANAVQRWWTVPRDKVRVVLNGIDTAPFVNLPQPHEARSALGLEPGGPVIGTVGRLSEVKQQWMLIKATARLRARFPDVRLLIVGDGPERQNLTQRAAEAGIADRVVFAGYQAEPQRFLAAMDVFALTSRSEGFPVSLLEAWAAGRPVVCSAVGGIPAAVTTGEDGLLFPRGDEGALVSALERVLQDEALAHRFGERGREKVTAKYSLERMASEYDALYAALVARSS